MDLLWGANRRARFCTLFDCVWSGERRLCLLRITAQLGEAAKTDSGQGGTDVDGDSEGFRAQLVVPQQQQLFDYWLSCCDGHDYPSRQSVRPSEIPHLLPFVSLIDTDSDCGFRIRLAGTQLREVFDREITGLPVAELERMSSAGYWQRACACVLETGFPAQGAIRSPRTTKDHLVQFWMRLPLSIAGDGIDQLLGFDICIPSGEVAMDLSECDEGVANLLAI